MKLTEAIRKGAAMNSQAAHNRHDNAGRSCVLGAVEDAFRHKFEAELLYPQLNTVKVTNPETGDKAGLASVMADLNNGDNYYTNVLCKDRREFPIWSREKIADWIDTNGLDMESVPLEKLTEMYPNG